MSYPARPRRRRRPEVLEGLGERNRERCEHQCINQIVATRLGSIMTYTPSTRVPDSLVDLRTGGHMPLQPVGGSSGLASRRRTLRRDARGRYRDLLPMVLEGSAMARGPPSTRDVAAPNDKSVLGVQL